MVLHQVSLTFGQPLGHVSLTFGEPLGQAGIQSDVSPKVEATSEEE